LVKKFQDLTCGNRKSNSFYSAAPVFLYFFEIMLFLYFANRILVRSFQHLTCGSCQSNSFSKFCGGIDIYLWDHVIFVFFLCILAICGIVQFDIFDILIFNLTSSMCNIIFSSRYFDTVFVGIPVHSFQQFCGSGPVHFWSCLLI